MPTPPFTDPWLPLPVDGVVSRNRAATPITVWRLVRNLDDTVTVNDLPNVVCTAIQEEEGPSPATAEFRYRFDGRDPDGPQAIEQALNTAFHGDHYVDPGNWLGVKAVQPNGTVQWIFSGTVLEFDGTLDARRESVTLRAVGRAKRLWDEPIGGATWRQADDVLHTTDVVTDLVGQFNPRGQANASPSTSDSGTDPYKYPVFLDPAATGTDTAMVDYPRVWSIPMAVAYLLYTENADQTYVTNPTRDDLDGVLVAREPIAGTPFDPRDPTTYTALPIAAPDQPFTGRMLPNVVHELVREGGFGFRFYLTDATSEPVTALSIWHKQSRTAKPLLLQARGSNLDPQWTNVGGARMSRDLTEVVTRWRIRGALDRYEVSFVLAPGFPSVATDASENHLSKWVKSHPDFTDIHQYDYYRLWVLDEIGLGHYLNASDTPVVTALDLDGVLGSGNWVKRQRSPVGQLISVDPTGAPMRWRAHLSDDYAGAYPAVWDGTGHWRSVGGFQLLHDRVGVRLDVEDPNKWDVGKSEDTPLVFWRRPVVHAVEAVATPSTSCPAFFIRLTCVIEADVGLDELTDASATAALAYSVIREVDARDRYRRDFIYGKSEFKATTGIQGVRDDGLYAQAEAVALRAQSDNGTFDATVTIPRFTAYYEIGDRISSIDGRDLSLRTDNGGDDFAPVYPVVVGRRWELGDGQQTTLHLSDAGLARRRFAGKHRRGS
jgi:hypothetical protein